MRKTIHLLTLTAVVAGCSPSADNSAANEVARAGPVKKKPAHCFFKDAETKDWSATRDKDGNVVVKGKAYRSDSRYQALLAPPVVSGATAELSPTIQQNATGYAAPDNWWPVTATIPDSAAIDTVKVSCGAKTLADIKVALKS